MMGKSGMAALLGLLAEVVTRIGARGEALPFPGRSGYRRHCDPGRMSDASYTSGATRMGHAGACRARTCGGGGGTGRDGARDGVLLFGRHRAVFRENGG